MILSIEVQSESADNFLSHDNCILSFLKFNLALLYFILQPTIFYDHFYDFGIREIINELIEARQRAGIHCRSSVKIFHANNEGYVAQVGDSLVMKLGHFDWNPSKENQLDGSWQKFVDKGSDYQLWLRQ